MGDSAYISRVHVLLGALSLDILRHYLVRAKRTRKKMMAFTLNGSTSLVPRKVAVGLIESHIKLKDDGT